MHMPNLFLVKIFIVPTYEREPKGRGTHSPAGEGVGGSNSDYGRKRFLLLLYGWQMEAVTKLANGKKALPCPVTYILEDN